MTRHGPHWWIGALALLAIIYAPVIAMGIASVIRMLRNRS